MQNLIASCRKTCKALGIKGSKDCKASELVKCMNDVPAFILDNQESSARGAARTALALVHARNPDVDLELCTAGVPAGSKTDVLMAKVRGLDNRVVNMINHDAFYDKEKLAPELLKMQAERRRLEEVRMKEELDSDAEGYEGYSEEAEPKEIGTGTGPTVNTRIFNPRCLLCHTSQSHEYHFARHNRLVSQNIIHYKP